MARFKGPNGDVEVSVVGWTPGDVKIATKASNERMTGSTRREARRRLGADDLTTLARLRGGRRGKFLVPKRPARVSPWSTGAGRRRFRVRRVVDARERPVAAQLELVHDALQAWEPSRFGALDRGQRPAPFQSAVELEPLEPPKAATTCSMGWLAASDSVTMPPRRGPPRPRWPDGRAQRVAQYGGTSGSARGSRRAIDRPTRLMRTRS